MSDKPKQLWLPSPIAKQSNSVSRSRFVKGTTIGFRVAVMIASQIKKTDTVLESYEVNPNVLADYNLSTSDLARMQRSMDEIASTQIAVLEGSKYRVYPMFGVAEWDSKTKKATVKLNHDLKDHYIQVSKDFTLLPTDEFKRLTGVFAQILFQYLLSWRTEPETYIEIDELHKKLGTHKDEKLTSDFNRFQRRILDPVANQIDKKTSLKYEWETRRGGRGNRVQGVRFVFADGLINKLRSPIYSFGKLSPKMQDKLYNAFELQTIKGTPLEGVLTDRTSEGYRNSMNTWLKDMLKKKVLKPFPK